MSRSITKQLEHAIHACYTPGNSKRADKFNAAIDTSWKIYSTSSRRDMLDLAKDFGKFVKEAYPEANRAYLITGDVLQAYIDKKASTCVDATLDKINSRLGKLEKCCEHAYENSVFTFEISAVRKPASTKNAEFVKDTPVPLEVSKTVIETLDKKRSQVSNAVRLEVVKGPEGGAKGGRPRIIPLSPGRRNRPFRKP